jgi:hypothetical protein
MKLVSLEKVSAALAGTKRPLSIPDIQEKTGLAYHTVKAALHELGATQHEHYPARFTATAPADMAVEHIPVTLKYVGVRALEQGKILLPRVQIESPVAEWNKDHERLAVGIASITLNQDTNLKEFVDAVGPVLIYLTNIVERVAGVQNEPGGFEMIGGNAPEIFPIS